MYENKEEIEKVILFAVDLDNGEQVPANLDELEELVATAGAETLGRMIQNKDSIEKATYLGTGKVEDLRDMVERLGATGVVCDDELSPIQMKNLEQELDTKVMDRTMIILDIFAKHATTREGKLQVELAQLKYRSNRLIGMGQVMSRLGGGIGTRGPGEKKLEVDRRLIRERISKLSADLKDDIAHREVMRKQRLNSHIPIVSIVGYTNAGKSTLLNHMTQAGVLEEDKLFATLDPTSRNYKLPNGQEIILTDTEGQAHTEENGGQKQKEDTNSEEDSETPVQEIPDVEVTVSGEDADAQAARELEEKIEDGEVMMLSGAENTFRAKETVHLEKGETIYYPSYIGNYLTCWFTVNGKIAYCLESHRSSPPSGDYVAQVLDSNKNLQNVLYYGYGGAGDITGSYLSGKSAEEKYVYTHIAASYAYAGEAGFTGCKYEDLVNAGVIAYIDHLFAMEEPPKGEISLSKTSVKAVRNGNVQKTPDITLSGDHRNYISVHVPKEIKIYNKTKVTYA